MNDCIWCGSLSHDYDNCPVRAEVADRDREYAELSAALAPQAAGIADPIVPAGSMCTRRLSSAHDDEITYECGHPAMVAALTTAGQWEPHCDVHVQGWPADRVRR